ncbi:MAG: TRAM domain-containing protein, partial [Burkholderiaceae bacterium]
MSSDTTPPSSLPSSACVPEAPTATTPNEQQAAKPRPETPPRGSRPVAWLYVHSMDLNAQGVAHTDDGKVVFVDGALPGEWVSAQVHRKKAHYEMASLQA